MKRLLITGFEPFDNEKINPSLIAVESLGDKFGDYSVSKLRLPVVFGLAAEKVLAAAEDLKPDVILCIGQAGGRGAITPELVGINLNDVIENVDFQSGNKEIYYSIKVLGKGSKERIVYLNDQCVMALKNYTQLRPQTKGENAMFISKQYRRISNRRVEQIIEARLKACGLSGKGISVHKLRHTAATLMYQNGVDVRVLKEVLGHENLNTTQIYTHVVNQQLRDAMNNNPISQRLEIETAPTPEELKEQQKKRKKKDKKES